MTGPRVTADSRVSEVMACFPSTGPVFIQLGRLYVARAGELYASYPDLTVGEYASLNEIPIGPLLGRLSAAAEADEFARRPSDGSSRSRLRLAPVQTEQGPPTR